MPSPDDPEDLRVTDDLYSTGRAAFEDGASVLENPWPGTGHIGRAWFAGWLDALADRLDGGRPAPTRTSSPTTGRSCSERSRLARAAFVALEEL